MKNIFKATVWLSFAFGIFALLNELFFDMQIKNSLINKSLNLLKDSKTTELIENSPNFISSQLKAIEKRVNKIFIEFYKHFYILGSAYLFLNIFLRKKLQSAISKSVDMFPKTRHSPNLKELLFISLVSTLIFCSIFGTKPVSSVENDSIPVAIMVYSAIGFLILPTVYLIIKKLLKAYSNKLIVACYLAYFIKAISEFVTIEDVNLKTMQKVDISEFSQRVREYLTERKIENKVYSQKLKKSPGINAALIGWGPYERIEIYGDYRHLTDSEFESILMHEIGHSQDFSLMKKIAILFILKAVEMGIVVAIYTLISSKFADNVITTNGAFIILFLIYYLFINRWLLIFHKLASQTAESSADTLAKKHGYGNELSKVLFDITVKAEASLRSTWLFNSLKSYHPTIYDRIEYLRS